MKFQTIRYLIDDCLFPVYCPGCGLFLESRKNSFLCPDCRQKFSIPAGFYCPTCFRRQPWSANEDWPRSCDCRQKSNLDLLGFAASYEESAIKELIHNFKYRLAKKIAFTLADFLIDYLKKSLPAKELANDQWLIIPIPLHRKRKNWRGFNQAEEMAKFLSAEFQWPLETKILERTKNTEPQAEKEDWRERAENIADAFQLAGSKEISGLKIILLDDVRASGATLEQAALALKSGQPKKILGLTVAR